MECITTRTILLSVAGGTASLLGGGKFANGAMSSAFIFMFNDMADYRLRQKRGRYNIMDELSDKAAIDNGLSREEARVKATKAYGTMGLALLSAPIALEGGGAMYYFVMRNPETVIYTGETAIPVINDIINPSLPAETPFGQLYFIYEELNNKVGN